MLRAFVDAFNALEAKHGVDTVDREEVVEAFQGLATAGGVAGETAAKWLDAWRDF